jgi:hypothetical protein
MTAADVPGCARQNDTHLALLIQVKDNQARAAY